jgi:hypothetical protein
MPFGQFALTHFKWISGADPKKSTIRSRITAKKGTRSSAKNRLPGSDGNGEG